VSDAYREERTQWVLRSPRGRLSVRVRPRTAVVCLILLLGTAAVGTGTLATGDYPLPVADVIRTLLGQGTPAADFIVTTLRLPRLLTGLLVGGSLGVSGALLQSLSGNPLGSPDIIGFTSGAATGALVVITVLGGDSRAISAGAVLGGLGTSLLVYLLALRRGGPGLRLILVGIGVSAMLVSTNYYLITRANLQTALAAQVWLTGSLNGRGWEQVWPAGLAVAVLLPVALGYGRRLALLELGDETAGALGVPVQRSRLALLVVSVALAAVATAVAGPIGFVALSAPHLARRLTRSAGPPLLAAALLGALLLASSDLLTQRVFAPAPLPVGITTGAIGGLYLAWLLVHEWRRGRA
jgi:iron complex transport system permease protein